MCQKRCAVGVCGVKLKIPDVKDLKRVCKAIDAGWGSDSNDPVGSGKAMREKINNHPLDFVKRLRGDIGDRFPSIVLPDGTAVERLPGFSRWIFTCDTNEFVGQIGFRGRVGCVSLPVHCLGHIGYTIVPAWRGKGHASAALVLMLREVKKMDLPYVYVCCDNTNLASARVMEKVGCVMQSLKPYPDVLKRSGFFRTYRYEF